MSRSSRNMRLNSSRIPTSRKGGRRRSESLYGLSTCDHERRFARGFRARTASWKLEPFDDIDYIDAHCETQGVEMFASAIQNVATPDEVTYDVYYSVPGVNENIYEEYVGTVTVYNNGNIRQNVLDYICQNEPTLPQNVVERYREETYPRVERRAKRTASSSKRYNLVDDVTGKTVVVDGDVFDVEEAMGDLFIGEEAGRIDEFVRRLRAGDYIGDLEEYFKVTVEHTAARRASSRSYSARNRRR